MLNQETNETKDDMQEWKWYIYICMENAATIAVEESNLKSIMS